MFWTKKNKLPVTQEDKSWIDDDLDWLRAEFGEEHFLELKTITPTKEFFDREFDGSEKDAEYILARTMELMFIENIEIKLNFFSDSPVNMEDGSLLSSPAEMDGSWKSAAGYFESDGKAPVISIEISQLKNPTSLIATISHELSHQILLGENRIEENDEFLTDLTAITYGFGIFIGNSRFEFDTFSGLNGSGWKWSTQGYLPEQIIAYAMARLSWLRKEEPNHKEYLDKSIRKYFEQSWEWLLKNEN